PSGRDVASIESATSQILAASHPAVARRRPSGLKRTSETSPVWPRIVASSWPVATSEIRIVLSPPADAIRAPSGLKATACTRPEWPWKRRIGEPDPTSQRITNSSYEEEAARRPSGLNATDVS